MAFCICPASDRWDLTLCDRPSSLRPSSPAPRTLPRSPFSLFSFLEREYGDLEQKATAMEEDGVGFEAEVARLRSLVLECGGVNARISVDSGKAETDVNEIEIQGMNKPAELQKTRPKRSLRSAPPPLRHGQQTIATVAPEKGAEDEGASAVMMTTSSGSSSVPSHGQLWHASIWWDLAQDAKYRPMMMVRLLRLLLTSLHANAKPLCELPPFYHRSTW
jgi:hypothetical protein